MRRRAKIRTTVERLLAGRGASVMPVLALGLMTFLATLGLTVDGTRMMMLQSRLQRSIDAGGLSAAARYSTADIDAEVRRFAAANFLSAFIDGRIDTVRSTPSADEASVAIVAEASAPTVFMRIFGVDRIRTTARTEVTRAGKGGVELSLVLDVTGSMASDNKIGNLKVAANALLDVLFGDAASDEMLHVGIVPFAAGVNVGTSRSTWMKSSPFGWGGCTEARFAGYDVSDAPPVSSNADTLFDPATRIGTQCPTALTPLTSSKAVLKAAIAKLAPSGSTHIANGAAWGWYMISPKWRGRWGGTMGSTLPLDNGTKGMSKALVIMTDGDNTWWENTAYGPMNLTLKGLGKGSIVYSSDARLNVSANSQAAFENAAEAALDDKLTAVCTKIKNAGIAVYTISLGKVAKSTETRLENCASQKAYYFPSPGGAELKEAFAKIGDSLSRLRISR